MRLGKFVRIFSESISNENREKVNRCEPRAAQARCSDRNSYGILVIGGGKNPIHSGVRLKREKLSRPASLPIVFKFAIELAAT